ncbi:MAG: hypothetical protein E6H07_06230 [Bacteroidetes bacterium]|nr:MAG: hypothetical protein E6H07_06230 [Bacteroidota bacterium]
MKAWLRGFYYSFPIQLLFLHFKKYQALLIFWFVLFSTINGSFMKIFGADSLFLAPEYLGTVNTFGYAITGIAIGMFIVSWNITTFVLFSKNFRFLAATTNPFLKYCINNCIIPVLFLLYYAYKAWTFLYVKELVPPIEIIFYGGGFIAGLIFILAVSFIYFFRADRNIIRRMMPVYNNPKEYITHLHEAQLQQHEESILKVEWYFETPRKLKPVRSVSHYTRQFVDSIFKRHHFAAILSVFFAFLFLIIVGFFLEEPLFQIPAAASITIFFSIFIGVAGAFAYFLQGWTILYLVLLGILLNVFYKLEWIDPRNKAFGLDYKTKTERPFYSREGLLKLASEENMSADRKNMMEVMGRWKAKQKNKKPLLTLIAVSGGGHRSATFTLSMLQQLDSITNGEIMKNTFLVTGASGGMIGAAYFRELYLHKLKGENIRLQDKKYIEDISGDLLNPLFSSFVARDLISPAQKFHVGDYSYVKDRGYAFEEKLNENTRGFFDKRLKDYIADETAANIPLIFFSSVITRDAKRMMISTQPIRFMMQRLQDTLRMPATDPDAVDFRSFFEKQNPDNLRVLTALRMNATFPVVLPNVWLPSDPVIDVMDAGLRDNFGVETALRFLENFDQWIEENTSGVLLIQIRDRDAGGWEQPYISDDLSDHLTRPFFLLQHNWYKIMEYDQNNQLAYYTENKMHNIYKINFQYASSREEGKAALNFHLTQREKNDILRSLNSGFNRRSIQLYKQLLATVDSVNTKVE